MNRINLSIVLGLLVGATGCSGGDPVDNPITADSIVFLQRQAAGGMGDIFNYTAYLGAARLVQLEPPTADGELTVLCCDQFPEFASMDISGYDISFDATEIVFAGKLNQSEKFSLFLFSLTTPDRAPVQLPTDPNFDYINPVFLPGDKIFYNTNAVVEEGAPQFRDEYERRITTQVGVMSKDGTEDVLGARNLSHRVFPTVLNDGRIMLTQWDHLGEMNSGHLITMNPDMSTIREAYGKQDTGVTNSYTKAVEVAPGRILAIGSSRDRTIQSGTILDIRLGETYTENGEVRADRNMSEANASVNILTPQVPRGREPSFAGVGRYYDAYPLNAKEYPDLLVSWADGPVEAGTLEAAGIPANFGVYLYDSARGQRRPIWDDADYWDVFPRPLVARDAPPAIPPAGRHDYEDNKDAVLLGSMNVYDSSIQDFEAGSIFGVRVLEGFSAEEISARDFGLTEHEGSALLGVATVRDDGSWAAFIPPNIPIHVQAIDKFGMSLRSEPVWISGNAGETMVCGGCHADRAKATVINPGVTEALGAFGPEDLRSSLTRAERASTDYSLSGVIGVPWDLALQPLFDAKCVSCHDGTPSDANKSYTITDPETGDSMTWTFNLSGDEVDYGVGEEIMSGYSASHLSLLGPEMIDLQEAGLQIDGEVPSYVVPNHARDSELIKVLNPPVLYPTPDLNERAFEGPTHAETQGFTDLTADEYHLLVLMADSGGQFYARENRDSTAGEQQ
ncbi:hypothetical protein [Haliangium sp.]|uniref:HzsA-related protein n=1 Tax=Haliangium sp. TaxID=2663208 RepID=UPI003D10E6AC